MRILLLRHLLFPINTSVDSSLDGGSSTSEINSMTHFNGEFYALYNNGRLAKSTDAINYTTVISNIDNMSNTNNTVSRYSLASDGNKMYVTGSDELVSFTDPNLGGTLETNLNSSYNSITFLDGLLYALHTPGSGYHRIDIYDGTTFSHISNNGISNKGMTNSVSITSVDGNLVVG